MENDADSEIMCKDLEEMPQMGSWKMDYYHYQAAERHEPGDQRREPNLRKTIDGLFLWQRRQRRRK